MKLPISELMLKKKKVSRGQNICPFFREIWWTC